MMESFENLVAQFALVIRDGKQITIKANQLTIGDLVEVKFGDRILGDIHISEAPQFEVNSSLSGESEPQSRSPESTHSNTLETKKFSFFSTNAIE